MSTSTSTTGTDPDLQASRIDAEYVARSLRLQAQSLREVLSENPVLRRMIHGDYAQSGRAAERDAYASLVRGTYASLLRMSRDYVQFTVPALRAASEVLAASADPDDRLWSVRLAAYAAEETDESAGQGHETWATADLADLGVAHALTPEERPHPAAAEYGWYFVSRAGEHPYAILGAKSVLEELSVRVAHQILLGVRVAGVIPAQGDGAARFLCHHGELDVEHGRRGTRDLRDLRLVHQRRQVLEGAYVTVGAYRHLAYHYLS